MIETRRLNYEDFIFQKLTYNEKQGKLVIKYQERGGQKDGHTHESIEAPHPDLLKAMEALKPHVARILTLQTGWDFAREGLKSDFDALKGAVQGATYADNSVKVVTILMKGKEDTEGVKIAGSLKCLNGDMSYNIPVVRFNSDAMMIEKTVEKLVDDIKGEAFGFIFQNKRKQYTIEEQEELDRKKGKKGKKAPKEPKNQLNLVDEAEKAEQEQGENKEEEQQTE